MHKAALLAVLAVFMSQVAVADVVRQGSIPEAYRGRWVAGAETESQKSVIVLSAKSYVGPETNCSVDWVSQTAGGRGSIYAAHLQCFHPAEGAGSKAMANLIIWPTDVDHIAVGPEFTNLTVFRRCSATCDTPRDSRLSGDTVLEESTIRSEVKSRMMERNKPTE
jgi:hypothetical protein